MSWYRASTISLTNGSTAVTGAATDFIANCAVGEGLLAPDGKVYEIAAIVSATALTLGSVYLGSTASGQTYAIIPSQSYLRDLALQAATLVNDYQSVLDSAGAGKFGDGTLGSPGIQFSSDSNTGLRRTGTDAMAVVTGGVDRITVDAAGAVAVVTSLSVAGVAVPTLTSTSILTNKTLALGSNTVSGTLAQFNTAVTDADLATLAGTETLTDKTLISPTINGGTLSSTVTAATAAAGDNDTSIATTAFVMREKESLPVISQSLHIGAVIKAIVYDTSKDSDGGAWRKRCADKSWYTETLGGDRWIGQYATISAAWTAAGSTTGAVYQASATAGAQTIGKYYTPTSSTTVTEVFRGVSREFPAVVGIVAESTRVVIYDLSAVGCPMWMVITKASGYMVDSVPTSVCAQNGQIIIGSTGLFYIALLQDAGFFQNTSNKYKFGPNLAGRNAAGTYTVSAAGIGIVNSTVNDVALTVLDNAPIDPATGIATPCIAVATAGGVSVILDSGAVVNSSSTSAARNVWFDSQSRVRWTYINHVACSPKLPLGAGFSSASAGNVLINGDSGAAYSATEIPVAVRGANPTALTKDAVANSFGMTAHKTEGTAGQSMVCGITTAYNSGWMPGDIRGAYLADTTAGTITASGELVTNGTFATDTSGWTAGAATLSVVSNKLRVTASGGTNGYGYQSIACVVGKTYSVSADITLGTGANNFGIGTTATGAENITVGGAASSRTALLTFIATVTTHYVTCVVSPTTGVADFDNISVKLAEPDRSVKNKGLVINGSLTKTAVASGAGLVAYSGFSGSNYLEQPYNSDLDFGTGDFCVMGWVNIPSNNTDYPIVQRGTFGADGFFIEGYGTGTIKFRLGSGALTTSTGAIPLGTPFLLCLKRTGSAIDVTANAVSIYSGTDASTVNSSGVLKVGTGNFTPASLPNQTIALFRISGTAPSADQIAHIYRTELPLFQASAQCTIAGSSTAVTALAYDSDTQILSVGTSYGRSDFRDLLRVSSNATPVTALAASGGMVIQA